MTILQDDGANRHIRFSKSNSSTYRFDLHTWPGFLCITGDCGSYVFSRLYDMFEFFDHSKRDPHDINPSYWGQKLESIDKNGGYKSFSRDKFQALVKEHFADFEFDDKAHRRAVKAALKSEDWGGNIESMDEAYRFFDHIDLDANPYGTWDGSNFRIDELWDHDLDEFTFRYIWCCRAIRWGIRQYRLGGDRFDRQAKLDASILTGAL
ncbi:hypothetical protein [Yoonia sp. I 8.24]|uniref:hypothetical protein n=1 Tax=Yoonia sp. I 8.24 TaxID=1537229 RepID=UPI001EDF7CC2|nr:hypothetical protein [Yoonia sp. I 8.24]MCG3267750.1 hypothetical protein [Yoonia sp. I 8.24]